MDRKIGLFIGIAMGCLAIFGVAEFGFAKIINSGDIKSFFIKNMIDGPVPMDVVTKQFMIKMVIL